MLIFILSLNNLHYNFFISNLKIFNLFISFVTTYYIANICVINSYIICNLQLCNQKDK